MRTLCLALHAGATGESDIHIVRSPKSGVSFFDLGNVEGTFNATRHRAHPVLQAALLGRRPVGAVRVVASSGGREAVKSS